MTKSSYRFSFFYLSVCFLVLLLTGCASKAPSPNYFTLKPITEAEKLTTEYSIGIQPVIMPSWLDQNRISWVDGDVNQIVLEHNRWVGPLSQVIDQNTLRNFNRLYPSASVSPGPWVRSATPDRILSFRIMALERHDNELSAEIAISVLDQQRKELTSSVRTYKAPLADNAPAGDFARTLANILGQMNIDAALLLREGQGHPHST